MPRPHAPRPGETKEQCRDRIVRRRKYTAFSAFAGIAVLLVALSYTVFFPMTDFEVLGRTRYAKSVLEQAAAVAPRTQLLNLSTERVRKKLLDELPYLESVSVRRRFPHTLTVTVYDAKTVFAVKLSDGYVVISGKGRVLEITEKKPQDVIPLFLEEPFAAPVGGRIVFSGDKDKDDWVWLVFGAFVQAYEDCDYKHDITSLDMKNPYYPAMSYQDRMTLQLGSRDGFSRQLAFARRTIAALDKEDKDKNRSPSKGTLDLKVEGQSFFRKAEK